MGEGGDGGVREEPRGAHPLERGDLGRREVRVALPGDLALDGLAVRVREGGAADVFVVLVGEVGARGDGGRVGEGLVGGVEERFEAFGYGDGAVEVEEDGGVLGWGVEGFWGGGGAAEGAGRAPGWVGGF